MSRGVSFERVLEFFDNAPLRVANAAVTAGLGIVSAREKVAEQSAKRQSTAVSVPRKHRRTKAQIAADAAKTPAPNSAEQSTAATSA